MAKYEYYINEDIFIMKHKLNLFAQIISSLLFPICIFIVGVPEAIFEMKRLWKDGGDTYGDSAWKGSSAHDLIMKQAGLI